MKDKVSGALFDSTRKALRFALNHHVAVSAPVMNRMMQQASKRTALKLADGTVIEVAAPGGKPTNSDLKGLEGAATAGYVLRMLASLPDAQQMILMARSVRPTMPCACRAPCCAGERPHPTWLRSVNALCHHLMVDAALSQIKGKKGLSTGPKLRMALVGKYLVPSREITMVQIAEQCDITEKTVLAHKKPIYGYLTVQEDEGWSTLDHSLSAQGIVDFIE